MYEHVADGSHASARDGIDTRAMVLNDGASTTLDGQDIGDLENDILGRGPARELASKLDADNIGSLEFPREVGHDVDGIGTADTNSSHAETTAVGGVGVSADEKTTRESIVLQDDLVDDTGAGLPETNVVLGAGGRKEVVDFLVDADGASQILAATNLGLDQVIAVHSGRVGDGVHASGHELQDGHLSGGVLASNAVRAELQVRLATLDFLAVGIIQVRVENLLGIVQRSVETGTNNGEVLGHLLVVDEVVILPVVLADLQFNRR